MALISGPFVGIIFIMVFSDFIGRKLSMSVGMIFTIIGLITILVF